MENNIDSIMERIRARQAEIGGSSASTDEAKENETKKITVKEDTVTSSPTKVFGLSSSSNTTAPVYFRPPEKTETTPRGSTSLSEAPVENSTSSSTKKTSRFSMLAQEQEEFEYSYKQLYNQPKESFMKGPSPRMSVGERRPSVLNVPVKSPIVKSSPVKSSVSAPEVVNKNGPDFALGMSDFESRRIKFAQPIVNVNYLPNESSIFSGGSSSAHDMSTVLGGSAEMMNVTTSSLSAGELSLNQQMTHENTMLNAQSCDNREAILKEKMNEMVNQSTDEYGAHTFMRKKVFKEPETKPRTESTSSSSVVTTTTTTTSTIFTKPTSFHTFVSSPKPFSKEIGKSVYSPVQFTPKSTSSPKTIPLDAGVLSPSKSAAVEGSIATQRRIELERQLLRNNQSTTKTAPMPVPVPRHVAAGPPIQSTPHHPYQAQKKTLFAAPAPTPRQQPPPLVATAPLPVQTQWRGQANTPVVQGARAEDKTAGTQLVGAGVGKLKNLKSRWEFSSATGTPIHPDATEDSLIATAIKMKESAIPKTIGHRVCGKKGASTSSINSQNAVRSNTASPVAKNQKQEHYQYVDEDDDNVFVEDDDDLNPVTCTNTSKFIDDAFGFMEGTNAATPSPFRNNAPLAKGESPLSPMKKTALRSEVIEEEEVSFGPEEEDETELETAAPEEEEVPEEEDSLEEETIPEKEEPEEQRPVYRKNDDTQLAYSVSFYRKFQKERAGDNQANQSVISPSAPFPSTSLTSPQKLRQLTTSHISATEDEMRRLNTSMDIEEKLVQQSQRALARARDDPSFRGSREEFEAQRALLVHVEKLRAMKAEVDRLQREGVRIVEGPRGTVTINQMSIYMERDFVKNYIEAAQKPEEVYYFVAVLRYADQVDVSKMVTSDNGINRHGILEFPVPLKLTEIPPDFRATLEIYGQRSTRESTTHANKFKLKGATLKPKNLPGFLGGSTSSSSGNKSVHMTPKDPHSSSTSYTFTSSNTRGGQSSSSNPPVASTRFNLLASVSLDINCNSSQEVDLPHIVYPLSRRMVLRVKKEAVDGVDVVHKGFISMYQRTNEGLGSWTRYWSVIEDGEMKFWKQPEDEKTKGYLVLMDLSTCLRPEAASVVRDVCPFPNSLYVDVWVPKTDNQSDGVMSLRVMLAADTADDLQKWLSAINTTSRQLCTWRKAFVMQ